MRERLHSIALTIMGLMVFLGAAQMSPGDQGSVLSEDQQGVILGEVVVEVWFPPFAASHPGARLPVYVQATWPDGERVDDGVVLLILNLPLAPNGLEARDVDSFSFGHFNRFGEAVCPLCEKDQTIAEGNLPTSIRIPLRALWPDEDAVWATLKVAVVAGRGDELAIVEQEIPVRITRVRDEVMYGEYVVWQQN